MSIYEFSNPEYPAWADRRIAVLEAKLLKARELVCNNLYDGSERIAELEQQLAELREALMNALECIEGAAEGHGVDFYAYAKEIKAALPEEEK